MYICTCDRLKLTDRIVRRGDPVPEAASWSESVRRAHLNHGLIAKTPDVSQATAAPAAVSVMTAPAAGAAHKPQGKKHRR